MTILQVVPFATLRLLHGHINSLPFTRLGRKGLLDSGSSCTEVKQSVSVQAIVCVERGDLVNLEDQ